MTCPVVALSGNPRPTSRTAAFALTVARAILELEPARASAPVCEIDLANPGADPDHLRGILADAEVLVVASPTYKATYTGLLKTFVDGLAPAALRGVVAVPVMVAGDRAHALAVEVHLRPLLIELGASCPTPGLFAQESQLGDPGAIIGPWLETAAPALRAALDARAPV
jgi:FMN reductase